MIISINEFKLLNEKFINLWNKNDMYVYIDEIYNILVNSYKSIGGFLTANSGDELIKKCDLIKIVKRNNEISALACYKINNTGRKLICGGTNETEQGKNDLFMIIQEDIKQINRNAYTEVSGKLEHIYLKYGASIIPNILVSSILSKTVELDPDGFHYSRIIKGQKIKKILVGNVNM